MTTRLHAVDYDDGVALLQVDDTYVTVDVNRKDVRSTSSTPPALSAGGWLRVAPDMDYPKVWAELAEASVATLEVRAQAPAQASPNTRRFRVPAAVRDEARRSLSWSRDFERGRTYVGEILAEKLVNQPYLTLFEIARLHRYFSRVAIPAPTEAAGWNPGEAGYPADDRIKYGLRGGEACREWCAAVAKKHPLTADASPLTDGKISAVADSVSDTPDAGSAHEYEDNPDNPGFCVVCGAEPDADVHDTSPALDGQDDVPLGDGGGLDVGSDLGFEYDPANDYFGMGVDPDETTATALYMHDPESDAWSYYDKGSWVDSEAPEDDSLLIMLDPDSASALAKWLDETPADEQFTGLELSTLNPHEAALFAFAEAEEDWEFVERVAHVFDIYDSQERSVNAKKQVRSGGGRFGSNPGQDSTDQVSAEPKAHLTQPHELVTDVAGLIDQFLSDAGFPQSAPAPDAEAPAQTPQPSTADAPVTASGEFLDAIVINSLIAAADSASGAEAQPAAAQPLYLAIVDSNDTTAVLDLVAIMPAQQATAWKRDNGTWVQAPNILSQLKGATPPPVVQLTDPSEVADVEQQVDKATASSDQQNAEAPGATGQNPATGVPNGTPTGTENPDQHPTTVAQASNLDEFAGLDTQERHKLAKKGYALPDGSYPVRNADDLKKAVKAVGRAKNPTAAKKHIVKRARALRRPDLVPDDWKSAAAQGRELSLWGPNGEILNLVAVGGTDVTPEDYKNTERLREYWTHGEGAAKIGWAPGSGSWRRCVALLSKYLTPKRAPGYCTLRMHDALGIWPGDDANNPERDLKHAADTIK